jgi:hypothetical protein
VLRAAIPSEVQAVRFSEEKVKKSHVLLSEVLGPKAMLSKDLRLKHTAAIRYEATYQPTDQGDPINLPVAEVNRLVKHAHAILANVQETKAFTSLLHGKEIKLPIGIKKTVGNNEVIIILDSIIFTSINAYAELYAVVKDNKNDTSLVFRGRNIQFTKEGGFTGDARLELLQRVGVKFGPKINIDFLVDQTHSNYLIFDCNGFKRLHIDTRVEFSRDILIPESTPGTADPNPQSKVSTGFVADVSNLDDFVVELSNMPSFQVPGMDGLSCKIDRISFDHSSLENPSSIVFPAGYTNPSLTSGGVAFWEGFYIQSLTITLPSQFKLKSSDKRINIQLKDALIDKVGFTGKAIVNNLLPINEGDMSGWQFSINFLELEFVNSTPVSAGFKGELIIPITKETERFSYSTLIQNKNYNFVVSNKDAISIPMFGAGNVLLDPNSSITVALKDSKFEPRANLNGTMDIKATINGSNGDNNTSNEGTNLSLLSIAFQNLLITTSPPYVSFGRGGGISFGSEKLEQKMARLPISISNVGVRNESNEIGLSITLQVNLVGEAESGGGFSGTATTVIWAEHIDSKWRFKKVSLTSIQLNQIQIANLTISGGIAFFREDMTYGSGFSGNIDFRINLINTGNISAKAICIFGKKEQTNGGIYRYFAFDLLAQFPKMPVFPGLLYLNALGGGASYRMAMQNTSPPNSKFISNSGVTYVPDESKGLGLKALIGAQGESAKMYSGQLIFEIEFNRNFGLSMIAFSGYVELACIGAVTKLSDFKNQVAGAVKLAGESTAEQKVSTQASSGQIIGEMKKMGNGGALMAQWRMVFDFNNKTAAAVVNFYVDLAGIINGNKGENLAGSIDILFSPREWHVCAGTPNSPLEMSYLSGLFNMSAYFMMGQNLPSPLPMPSGRSANFPSSTNGMGLGARIGIEARKNGTIYFRAALKIGFDALISHEPNKTCGGKPKGIKGWYGYGQVFLSGSLRGGIKGCIPGIPYPCNCDWCCCGLGVCICPCRCDWCKPQYCADVSAGFDIDIEGIIEAPNPTYVEASIYILDQPVTIKVGDRCL